MAQERRANSRGRSLGACHCLTGAFPLLPIAPDTPRTPPERQPTKPPNPKRPACQCAGGSFFAPRSPAKPPPTHRQYKHRRQTAKRPEAPAKRQQSTSAQLCAHPCARSDCRIRPTAPLRGEIPKIAQFSYAIYRPLTRIFGGNF